MLPAPVWAQPTNAVLLAVLGERGGVGRAVLHDAAIDAGKAVAAAAANGGIAGTGEADDVVAKAAGAAGGRAVLPDGGAVDVAGDGAGPGVGLHDARDDVAEAAEIAGGAGREEAALLRDGQRVGRLRRAGRAGLLDDVHEAVDGALRDVGRVAVADLIDPEAAAAVGGADLVVIARLKDDEGVVGAVLVHAARVRAGGTGLVAVARLRDVGGVAAARLVDERVVGGIGRAGRHHHHGRTGQKLRLDRGHVRLPNGRARLGPDCCLSGKFGTCPRLRSDAPTSDPPMCS